MKTYLVSLFAIIAASYAGPLTDGDKNPTPSPPPPIEEIQKALPAVPPLVKNPHAKTKELVKSLVKNLRNPRVAAAADHYSLGTEHGGQTTAQMVIKTPDGRRITANYRFGGPQDSLIFMILEKNGDLVQVGDCSLSGKADVGDTFQANGVSAKTYLYCEDDEKVREVDPDYIGVSFGDEHADYYQQVYEDCVQQFIKHLKKPVLVFDPSTTG